MDRKEKGEDHGDALKKGPSPLVIIIAVAVLLLLAGVVVYFKISGGDVGSIAVGATKETDGILITIRTTSNGFGEYDGGAKIEIIYKVNDQKVYEGEVQVNGDSGSTSIEWEQFVWGNGDYRVIATAEGESDWAPLAINSIIEDVDVNLSDATAQDRTTPTASVEIEVIPENRLPYQLDPTGYSFNGSIETPSGDTILIGSENFDGGLDHYSRIIEHEIKGDYMISGKFENTFCKSDSPYSEIIFNSGKIPFDAFPFADAGPDQEVDLTDGEADVTFDASGSWDDGTILNYEWEFEEGVFGNKTEPITHYTYTGMEEGETVFVYLRVRDDDGKNSTLQYAAASSLVVTFS